MAASTGSSAHRGTYGSGARRGTYSIVARDPGTGELGVAVQSHWFGVGAVVAWARPGVGSVATQSVAEVAHGPNTLDALQRGLSAEDAVAEVLHADELARYRQLGVVDARGRAVPTQARIAFRTRVTPAARGSRARRT